MNENETFSAINSIILELEQLKKAIRELEEKIKERDLKDG
jgi:hypothetical protein